MAPKIFISYRDDADEGYAFWLYDKLAGYFGEDRVLMAVDEPGVDPVKAVKEAVSSCAVLIALVGKQWASITDADGRRRLDDPKDIVRLGIATALRRNIKVIPVQVGGAAIPSRQDLPRGLKKLCRRQAHEISASGREHDVERLIEDLDEMLNQADSKDHAAKPSTRAIPVGATPRLGEFLRLEGPIGRSINSIAFSPDGLFLAAASEAKTIELWQIPDGRHVATLTGHKKAVRSVAFSPDGSLLASASGSAMGLLGGHDVKLWQMPGGRERATLKGHHGFVTDVAFSPDGKLLASASEDCKIKLWTVPGGREIITISGPHSYPVNSVAFSPDGKLLASASGLVDSGFNPESGVPTFKGGSGNIILWEMPSGRQFRSLEQSDKLMQSVAFSPDGRLLASAAAIDDSDLQYMRFSKDALKVRRGDMTIKLWAIPDGRELASLMTTSSNVRCVIFSPDGALLAAVSSYNVVTLWRISWEPS